MLNALPFQIGVTSSDPPLALPPLSDPVPEGWISENGNYYCIYAMNLSLLDPITLFAPESKLGDGVLWLVIIRVSMLINPLFFTDRGGQISFSLYYKHITIVN
jgi:hypothetical protein